MYKLHPDLVIPCIMGLLGIEGKRIMGRIVALSTVLLFFFSFAANLSDFPFMLIEDGELKATIVVGKDASTSDVVGAINIAATLAQETHRRVEIAGGGIGIAKVKKEEIYGRMFRLNPINPGTLFLNNSRDGFLIEGNSGLKGLFFNDSLPFLQDRLFSPVNEPDDKFRIYDMISLGNDLYNAVRFSVNGSNLHLEIPANSLKYKLFIEASENNDFDLDGVIGNDNINDYANYSVSRKGYDKKFGLGMNNYLPFKVFGTEVRLYEFNTDMLNETRIGLIKGEKKVIRKGRVTEFKGYQILINDVGGGNFFEIVTPLGQTHMFSPNYRSVRDQDPEYEIKKLVSNLTVSIGPDCWENLSEGELWVGIGDPRQIMTAGTSWRDNQNIETDWVLENICCENVGTNVRLGMKDHAQLSMEGSYGCSAYEHLGTGDGRTCMLEFSYKRNRTESNALFIGKSIEAPDAGWGLKFHGLDVVGLNNTISNPKIPLKDMRALVSLNAGDIVREFEIKKGDNIGEFTTEEIVPDSPTGDYFIYDVITTPVALLDSEISDATSDSYGDFILVGGPSSNTLMRELGYTKWDFCNDADHELPCDTPVGRIELKENAFTPGKNAIVAAGWSAEQTRAACYILQHYFDYNDELIGNSLKFKTAESVILPIEAADISFT